MHKVIISFTLFFLLLFCDEIKIPSHKIDGKIIVSGKWGSASGEFGYKCETGELPQGPSGIAMDNMENIYVIDKLNNRIQKFDAEGNICKIMRQSADIMSSLNFIAVQDDRIFLAGSDRIFILDTTGTLAESLSVRNPRGLVMAEDKGFYVRSGVPAIWYKYSSELNLIDSIKAIEIQPVGGLLFVKHVRGEIKNIPILDIGEKTVIKFYDKEQKRNVPVSDHEFRVGFTIIGSSTNAVYVASTFYVWKIDMDGIIRGKIWLNNAQTLTEGMLGPNYSLKAKGNKIYLADGTKEEFRIVMFEFPEE